MSDKTESPKTTKLLLVVSNKLKEALVDLAEKEDLTTSELCRQFLREGLKGRTRLRAKKGKEQDATEN